MSAHGISKGSEVARYAASLGLEAGSCAAVGDMPNDLSMIRWARVGLAVEAAHEQVLAAAAAVIAGPEDDGVAQFLDAVLAGR
jgi:hydroxymethylpyrimidine pyrophosphatase-like HAD family hydrolase